MRSLAVLILLAACASPSLQYAHVKPVRVIVEGTTFAVYRKGDDVQAIRLNAQFLPRKAETFSRALAAIEQATGCTANVRTFSGDQNVVQGRVSCNDQ